ncbi:hypothetical protein [Sodalis ligni]|nr:hypothetical protein [Sodalis ligni]
MPRRRRLGGVLSVAFGVAWDWAEGDCAAEPASDDDWAAGSAVPD